MRKIVAAEFITLDGVYEAPGSDDTTLPEKRGWSMPFVSNDVGQVIFESMQNSDAMLLGRRTYADFAVYWTAVPADDPIGQFMNNQAKYVVSTTLDKAEWKNSMLIKGNVVEQLTRLKQQPGKNVTIVGSGVLVQSLLEADLIDEFELMLCPVVLGTGKPLFKEGTSTRTMKVIEVKSFDTGMTVFRLQPEKKA
ncbi:MAG TPA: dihydrofolate reductase family protein [Aggregatilineaceae bacterium]|nr:dihydrofolate reductase family protein [Aggregatilineaceae bacterium]